VVEFVVIDDEERGRTIEQLPIAGSPTGRSPLKLSVAIFVLGTH